MRKGGREGYRDLTKGCEKGRSDVFSNKSQKWQAHNQLLFILGKGIWPATADFLFWQSMHVSDIESSFFYTLRTRKQEVQQVHVL